MPRISITGPAIDVWYNAPGNGNGTSTWDVCKGCSRRMVGKRLIQFPKFQTYNGEPHAPESTVFEESDGGPTIEDMMFDNGDPRCTNCDCKLHERNY